MLVVSGDRIGLAILLCLVRSPLGSAVSISDVFTVKSGTTQGGCDYYASELAIHWQDSQKLLQAAADAVAAAHAADQIALKRCDGYFGIKSINDTVFAEVESNINIS